MRKPSSVPKRSSIVSMSANAWHGCAAAESPLITGTVAARREPLQRLVLVRANHDRIDVPRKHARRILGRLAATDHELVAGGEERLAAELLHRYFKGNTRAQGGLLEEEHQRASAQERAYLSLGHGLQVAGKPDQRGQLAGREVRDLEDVPAPKGVAMCWRDGGHILYIYAYGA